MNLTFKYDPTREVFPLKVGFKSQNSAELTEFAKRAQVEKIDIQDVDAVARLSRLIIHEAKIDVDAVRTNFQAKWNLVQEESVRKFQAMFASHYDLGELTAFLTVSMRCPYNIAKRFFFVPFFAKFPIRICLHELQHFYCYDFLYPIFAAQGNQDKFNEFKESLTILLNEPFREILEKPDDGYPQHVKSRERILAQFGSGKTLREMAEEW